MPNLVILIGDKQIIEIVFTTAIWSFCHFVPVLLDIPSSDDTCENKFAYTHWTSNSYHYTSLFLAMYSTSDLMSYFSFLKTFNFLYTAVSLNFKEADLVHKLIFNPFHETFFGLSHSSPLPLYQLLFVFSFKNKNKNPKTILSNLQTTKSITLYKSLMI